MEATVSLCRIVVNFPNVPENMYGLLALWNKLQLAFGEMLLKMWWMRLFVM